MSSLPKKVGSRYQYSDEFKRDAVRLSNERGVKMAAEELNISASMLSKWRKRHLSTSNSSSDKSRSYANLAKENAKLKERNRMLEDINSVLKKSTAIFSQSYMEKNTK